MHAAIRASHAPAKDGEIYELAKSACAITRTQVLIGQEGNSKFRAALDADDAANFPLWIKGVRERRAAFAGSTSDTSHR